MKYMYIEFLLCVTLIQHTARQFRFLKLVCFFTWLVGMFPNFELTQNREKTRNGLIYCVMGGLIDTWDIYPCNARSGSK
jgi:hypothetical protein